MVACAEGVCETSPVIMNALPVILSAAKNLKESNTDTSLTLSQMKFCFKAAVIASAIVAVSFAGDVQDGLYSLKKGDYIKAATFWERGCKANEPKRATT
ncbi:hypothetical protein AGMMS50229_09360 [Campylobacterota bacterium]|nr:hypothetical protein AGMMS50229_09360 [Campylobacterota bacterium]